MLRGEDFLAMHVNVRLWPLVARTGLHTLFGASAKCDLDVGFTIEGRADDELPEVLLGAVHMAHLRMDEVMQWPPSLGGAAGGGSPASGGGRTMGMGYGSRSRASRK